MLVKTRHSYYKIMIEKEQEYVFLTQLKIWLPNMPDVPDVFNGLRMEFCQFFCTPCVGEVISKTPCCLNLKQEQVTRGFEFI